MVQDMDKKKILMSNIFSQSFAMLLQIFILTQDISKNQRWILKIDNYSSIILTTLIYSHSVTLKPQTSISFMKIFCYRKHKVNHGEIEFVLPHDGCRPTLQTSHHLSRFSTWAMALCSSPSVTGTWLLLWLILKFGLSVSRWLKLEHKD